MPRLSWCWCVFFVCLCITSYHPAFSATSARLECLQTTGSYFSDRINATSESRWVKGSINGRKWSTSDYDWLFQDPECPQDALVNEALVGQNAIGCGKSMLMVGDSTIEHLYKYFQLYMRSSKNQQVSSKTCSRFNHCRDNQVMF
jgi:hypothetical protein